MSVQFPKTGVAPLLSMKWYIESLKDELFSIDNRKKKIPEFPVDKVARERRNAIDNVIRSQYYFGWTKGASTSFLGTVYRESSIQGRVEEFITTKSPDSRELLKEVNRITTIEHVLPISRLRDRVFDSGLSNLDTVIAEALLSPVALLLKTTVTKIKEISSHENMEKPFSRYDKYAIQVVTHAGEDVGSDWGMDDHWRVLSEIPEFNQALEFYKIT